MGHDAFTPLAGNAALLLALVFVYDLALPNLLRSTSGPRSVLLGLCLSLIAVAVMQYTWIFEPGIVFDTRSVVIGICGLFFGAVPVTVVMVIASFARILQGGAAAYTGVCVIAASGAIGLIWRRGLKRPLTTLTFRDLLGLGCTIHLVMLALMFTLPWETALRVVATIALPVLVLYPAATAAIGTLMVNRLKRELDAEALLTSEGQYRTLFETMVQGAICHDPEGLVLSANPAASAILGLPIERMAGQNAFEQGWFALREDGSEIPAEELPARQAVRTGRPVEDVVLGLLRPGGERRWVRTSSIPRFRSGEDRPYQVYTVFEDITERVQAEAEKDAIQSKLVQSQKMEALGLLAGGVAHDFNNLLTGIMCNLTLIRDEVPPSSPQQQTISLVEVAAQRAADLTRGLLTFSRGAVGHPVPLDVNMAVGETADLLRRTLPATLEIVRDFQADAWNVLADPTQLTQVVLNLAVNARDAMQGKGRLTLTVRNREITPEIARQHQEARSGEFVLLSVQDTGPGIPAEIMGRLFEPFQTTKPIGSGTGLGLSIVYGAVKQAGGWIAVESTPGAGARFDVFLPRCPLPAAVAPLPQAPPRGDCRGTVLVAEDEPMVAQVVSFLLQRSGLEVKLAENGGRALQALGRHAGEVDLVLLDMTMPGLTTEEVVQGIRELAPRLPILLNSGNAQNETVKRMLDEGSVQGFLPKPYDAHLLRESVCRLLPEVREGAPAAVSSAP